MRQIFKNYLATFIKNWLQTIGTVLFILMMCAIVIGMLASPLQIDAKINKLNSSNNKYDTFYKENDALFSSKFAYKYLYNQENYYDEDGSDILDQPNNGQTPILSDLFRKSVNDMTSNNLGDWSTNERQNWDTIANPINNGVVVFQNGALMQTGEYLALTDDSGNVLSSWTNSLRKMFVSNINDFVYEDYQNVSINQVSNMTEYASRLFTKLNTVLSSNGINVPVQELESELAIALSGSSIPAPGEVIAKFVDRYITTGSADANPAIGTKTPTSFKLYLLGFQVMSPEMYRTLSNPTYSYDLYNYVVDATLKNVNNKNAFDKSIVNENKTDGYKYGDQIEHQMYLKKTTTQSLFPSFGIDLKTVNDENNANQLQLDSGSRPSTIQKTDIKDIANGKKIPEIVLSSGYMNKNNLKIGDIISIPDGPEHNNVLSIADTSGEGYDNFYTSAINFKIVGSGEKFDDSIPSSNYTPYLEDIKNYTYGYIDNTVFNFVLNARWNNSSAVSQRESTIKFINQNGGLNVADAFGKNQSDNSGVFINQNDLFRPYSESSVSKSLNNIKIRVIIFIILGAAVLLLAFVFINFIIKKELNETRRQIGIFKSFGYKISELSWIFAIKTALTIFVGAILGYVVSIPLQMYSANGYESSVMFYFQKVFVNAPFLIVIFIGIPALFLLISYLLTLSYLKEPTLSLLNNGARVSKGKIKASLITKYLQKKNIWFNYRLQKSFIRSSYGKYVVVQILFAIASLTFTLMFGAQTLMYSVANQGFAVLKPEADHKFSWKNHENIGIDYGQAKYSISDINQYEKQDFTYNSYDSKNELKDVLNNNPKTSDTRFRINYLMSSISNTFTSDRTTAMNMLMPKNYYYNTVGTGMKNDGSEDSNIPDAFKGEEMAYSDFFLNWILTFKITDNNLTSEQISDSKNNLNNKMNFAELEKYAKQNPNVKIPMTSIMNGKNLDQFKQTIFGLSDQDINDKNNNLFLSDITKMITLELAQSYADNLVSNELKQYKQNANGKYANADIDKALNKVANDKVMKDFDPNSMRYWGMQNNPLINIDSLVSSSESSGSNKGQSTNSGISLSKLSPQTVSLIMAAAMLGYQNKDINEMPTITINQLFFNKESEMLSYSLQVKDVDSSQSSPSILNLHDYSSLDYGDFNKNMNHDGVSNEQYEELAKDTNDKQTVNAIIPYGLSKARNLKVGDVLNASSNTKQSVPIKLKIVGINKSSSVSFGTGWSIDVDYNQFRNKFFDNQFNDVINSGTPIFNNMVSNEKMMTGDINIHNIASSINDMKFVGKNLALSINPGSSIFGSIFNGMVDLSKLLGLPIDSSFRLVTNPNLASTSSLSSVIPFNILRVGVDNVMSTINNVLILFMCLEAILLLIILVVVMNIIVEEATPIILTLKSLGYKQSEINWITMGSYITGAIISFIIAYILSLVIWIAFLSIAGHIWHIYIFMSYSWKAPVITFLVIGVILFIGWLVSDRKVNKIPLTLVTGFN